MALGYETRSSYIAAELHGHSIAKLALDLDGDRIFGYSTNRTLLTAFGFTIEAPSSDLANVVTLSLNNCSTTNACIGIDVSSFTRLQLAQIIEGVLSATPTSRLRVEFLYAPASSAGWEDQEGPIKVARPVHPAFTSWADDPSLPLTAVIGVGVETNFALGVAEFLDASSVLAFVPYGGDAEFDVMNAAANHEFFLANDVVRRAEYDLLKPYDLYVKLESLMYSLAQEQRLAVVPLGPKMFALCALLATASLDAAATVWRFSPADAGVPVDRVASGAVAHLTIEVRVSA
ncbi:hypothetical protein [Clavibacter michiganensis]|uniref:hypothetical protein n=1 Tax=Clavibacter michiganensis TaxID=28447 RepID=UPI0011C23BDC|nr:hypothetical protein [Clavibacter michiganensis]